MLLWRIIPALKHGKATESSIILKFSENIIKLFIFDNGIGCKKLCVEKGFGLQGMQQRVKVLNGDIKFGSDGKKGFNIHVEIPLLITEEEISIMTSQDRIVNNKMSLIELAEYLQNVSEEC